MEKKNCSELSNTEIRLYITTLENEFEAKKNEIRRIAEEMAEIENEYNKANNELKIRKTAF